jgi:hypothetical protein
MGHRSRGEIAVMLGIEYVETQQQLESGQRKVIQFVLSPQECIALAEKLTIQAQRALEGFSSSGRLPM